MAAAIWLYVAIRAVVLAFTADESITYFWLHGASGSANSANNQWLNTFLMSVGEAIGGQQPWVLRLPNVLSFGVYAGAWLFFVSRLKRAPAMLIAAVGCFGDPFLLEFFGLARGYGLSLSFASLALVVLLMSRTPRSQTGALLRLATVAVTGTLAFYANFSALNLVVAIGCVGLMDIAFAHRGGRVRFSWAGLFALAGLGVAWAAALLPGLLQLQHLQAIGQLYYGATSGLVHDTIGTLAQTWGYVYTKVYYRGFFVPLVPVASWALAVARTVVALAVVAIGLAAWRSVRNRQWTYLQRAALIVIISMILPVAERRIKGVLIPIDRAALVYLLGFTALFAAMVDELTAHSPRRVTIALNALTVAVACAAIVNLGRVVNFTSALTWRADAAASDVIAFTRALEKDRARPLTLIAPPPRVFALIYYAHRFQLSWLRLDSAPDSTPGGDVYEIPVKDRGAVAPGIQVVTVLADGTEIGVRKDQPRAR